MSKICLIRQPAGIGDIFFTQKIAMDYISKGYTVIWPVIEQFEFIKDYIKEFGIHPKTKMASMITSNKRWTRQHEIRHDFAMANKDKIDVFGRGIQEIPNKEIGLVDYRFSFCVENDTYNTYFTEKILDCFATGTLSLIHI